MAEMGKNLLPKTVGIVWLKRCELFGENGGNCIAQVLGILWLRCSGCDVQLSSVMTIFLQNNPLRA